MHSKTRNNEKHGTTIFFGVNNFSYNGFDIMEILLNDVIHDKNFLYVEIRRFFEFVFSNSVEFFDNSKFSFILFS